MNITTGVDLIELIRVQSAVERQGTEFLERIYTPKELAQFKDSIESLGVRFAAKEAVSKALGSGVGEVNYQEIEILRDDMDNPVLYLHGDAFQRAALLGFQTWSISLSHTDRYAIAFVAAVGE
jgi:holo-[acyl-carrier protein] synthase